MSKKVKALIFGEQHECRTVGEMIKAATLFGPHLHEALHVDDLEGLEEKLVDWEPSLVIVLADGAKGLECVFRTKECRPSLSVFWFSDDREFGMQSYRLNCAYFSTKPVTEEKLHHAIRRCDHIGIPYGCQ